MISNRRNRTKALRRMLLHLPASRYDRILTFFETRSDEEFAMFLAQCAHESCRGYYTRECWGPTKLQKAYEGTRNAVRHGNTKKGDGFAFRGSGLIQVTWKGTIAIASKDIYGDDRLIDNPELLDDPTVGIELSLWYWDKNKLSEVSNDITEATKIINGKATEGHPSFLSRRRELLAEARNYLARQL